ncbi:MAG: calcineurin-like phosphoesterase family protein [Bacteroidota bacterium]|nr:calcineurin-like phosphoesterase family protein [Bacteroidota bacterium]
MSNTPIAFNRRSFLRSVGISAVSLLTVEKILADPYSSILISTDPVAPIRVRGIVKSLGKGLKGIAVSDGVSVVSTKADGTFELVSNSRRPFVFLSIPSGYEIPTNPVWTAKFYTPIQPNKKNEAEVVWNLVPSKISDKKHTFLQLADPQMLDPYDVKRFQNETIPDIQQLIKSYTDPVFGVACGDIMFDHLELNPDYEKGIAQTAFPFFQVLGNHDVENIALTDEDSARTFMKYFGPTYYSFNRGDVHYVVLDDILWHGNGYIGYVEQQQYDWLAADLALVEKGKTVVVFMHIPPYNENHIRGGGNSASKSNIVMNRMQLYKILEGYNAHIISGHMHESERIIDGGIPIYVAGAVCGAWWTSDICFDGTPNGYAVYDVNGSELNCFYKATGKPNDHQLTVYAHGANPQFPDEILANIWDADKEWKIFWYEDGIRKGEMVQKRSFDPLSVKLYGDENLPKRYSWVSPVNADHIYFAPASKQAKSIVVEAINRQGKIFTQKI